MLTLEQIAGSAFGLVLESQDCPIFSQSGPIDTSSWKVHLILSGQSHTTKIPGKWINSVGPWTISFQETDTISWPPDKYKASISYEEPLSAQPRTFISRANLLIEVIRL